MQAEIHTGLFARMHVAAGEAKLGPGDPALDPARRHDAAPDPILPAFVIEDVARPELGEPEKPRPLDGVRLIAHRDQRAKRQAREVVARDKALAREIAVGVELSLGASALVQEQFDLAQRLALALLGLLAVGPSKPWHVDAPSGRVALLDSRPVELAPSLEGLPERRGRTVCLLRQPVG